MKDFHPFFYDCSICGKQQVNILAEAVENDGQKNRGSCADGKTDADAFIHPVKFRLRRNFVLQKW